MENYFIAYDIDEVPYFIGNLFELCIFTGLRIKDINYKFKYTDYITCIVDGRLYDIYKYSGVA